jgi:hypothetical protein
MSPPFASTNPYCKASTKRGDRYYNTSVSFIYALDSTVYWYICPYLSEIAIDLECCVLRRRAPRGARGRRIVQEELLCAQREIVGWKQCRSTCAVAARAGARQRAHGHPRSERCLQCRSSAVASGAPRSEGAAAAPRSRRRAGRRRRRGRRGRPRRRAAREQKTA